MESFRFVCLLPNCVAIFWKFQMKISNKIHRFHFLIDPLTSTSRFRTNFLAKFRSRWTNLNLSITRWIKTIFGCRIDHFSLLFTSLDLTCSRDRWNWKETLQIRLTSTIEFLFLFDFGVLIWKWKDEVKSLIIAGEFIRRSMNSIEQKHWI